MEECSEVIERAAKQSQFGSMESQPGQAETNQDRLRYEINDLKSIVQMLEAIMEIEYTSPEQFAEHFKMKSEKVYKYYTYSKNLGFVE
jgi:hypothetical protein